jgi:hypothetical protein
LVTSVISPSYTARTRAISAARSVFETTGFWLLGMKKLSMDAACLAVISLMNLFDWTIHG